MSEKKGISSYEFYTPNNDEVNEDSPIWDDVEVVAFENELGVESLDHKIAGIAYSSDKKPIGAVWYLHNSSEFQFHIAVSPSHQSKGIGSALLDRVLSEYNVLKSQNNRLEMDVHVINRRLTEALYRRGFHCYDYLESEDDTYEKMTDAPPTIEFFNEAKETSLIDTIDAIKNGSQQSNIPINEFSVLTNEWFKSPSKLDEKVAGGLSKTLQSLPLDSHDIHYLIEKLRANNSEVPCYNPLVEDKPKTEKGIENERISYSPRFKI